MRTRTSWALGVGIGVVCLVMPEGPVTEVRRYAMFSCAMVWFIVQERVSDIQVVSVVIVTMGEESGPGC